MVIIHLTCLQQYDKVLKEINYMILYEKILDLENGYKVQNFMFLDTKIK